MFSTSEHKTPPKQIKSFILSKDHWQNIKQRIRQFDECKIETKDEKDEACYKDLRAILLNGAEKGEACENVDLLKKKDLSSEAIKFREQIFDKYKSNGIPPILGVKTLAFVKSNFLTYYHDSQLVKFIIGGIGIEQAIMNKAVSNQKKEYQKKIILVEALIKDFSAKHPDIAKQADEIIQQMNQKNVPVKDQIESKTTIGAKP